MTYTYDPKKVSVIVNGRIITGYAEDGVITITWNEDRVGTTTGVKGDVVYTENADNTATATLPLMHTSASMAYLTNLCARRIPIRLDVADANADGGFHLSQEDCRITKMPDIPRSNEPTAVNVDIFIPDANVR